MKSNRKRTKVARATASDEHEEEDRLSSLPDSILCHILSFLPTKYAAITSVLSTRWKCLFLGVPNIDLDESLLLKPRKEQGSTGTDENHDFIHFVNRRLMLCKTAAITEFRLKCRRFSEGRLINLWLTTLLSRNVKDLQIEVQRSDNPPLCVPSGIFRSETLVVLKLSGETIEVRIPEFVCFPKLKVLKLKCLEMQFESKNFRLAEEGYPLLEELWLEGIRFPKNEENIYTLGISIRSLKVLGIGLREKFSRIDIETPHLEHLMCKFVCYISEMEINFCRSDSLLSADIYYSYGYGEAPWLLELLIKELSECVDYLPQFPNLTYLGLYASGGPVWSLLQLAPNLKTLVCYAVTFGDILPQENEPVCVAATLTEIRITNFEESDEEVFEAIRFLLEHAAVLEKMVLEPNNLVQWTTFKQLLKQKRRSPNCEVEFIHLESTCPISGMRFVSSHLH